MDGIAESVNGKVGHRSSRTEKWSTAKYLQPTVNDNKSDLQQPFNYLDERNGTKMSLKKP